ncbi:MAG: hypothetical protein HZB38_11515 [Planctomycetes bacterium]|nr:hypothetical protein [Planctomycetota bacterium]
MHPHVERFPTPEPDFRRFLQVLRRERPDRVPLIELAIHPRVVAELLAEPFVASGDPRADLRAAAERTVRLQHRLGYDVVKISAPIPFDVPRLTAEADAPDSRQWLDEHKGPIAGFDDLERFAWPRPQDVDFGPVEAATGALADGMAIIGFSGGVLEFAIDLMGMQGLMIASRRQPDLVAAVIERVGRIVENVFEQYCRYDAVRALWLGDDLGHKHSLLISPEFLKRLVVPWYQRYAALAHAAGRPFLLHSCGDTASILPTIVAQAGIDAKHSFEDGIEPVERFYDRWHSQIAVLGGLDLHLLASGDEPAIKLRMHEILKHCAPRGGYAAGSGNSIPDYVPAQNYLAMLDAVHEFNAWER